MVQNSRKRFFRRYELKIEPLKAKGNEPQLFLFSKNSNSLYKIFETAVRNSSNLTVENEASRIKLINIQENDKETQSFTLFFVCYNLDPITPMVGKETDGGLSLRSLEKEQDENVIHSVHLIIGLNRNNQILAVLEEVDGIPMGQLIGLLNKELKNHTLTYKTENNSTDTACYAIKASGYLSERLQESLKKGTIQGLTLISPLRDKLSCDECINQNFSAQELILKVKIQKKTRNSSMVLEWAKQLLEEKSKEGFEKIRFQLAFDGRKKTIAMTRTEEAREKLYVLSVQVEFDEDLSPCTESINPIIVEKAVTQL